MKTAAKPLGGSKSSLGQAARVSPAAELRHPALSLRPLSPPAERTSAGGTQGTAGRGQASLLRSSRTIFVIFTRCGTDRCTSIVLWLTLNIMIFYGAGKQPAL